MVARLALAAVVPAVVATAPTPAPSAPTADPTSYPGCSVETYYSGVREQFDKLEGLALQKLLHNLISGHTIVPYTSTNTDTWDALEVLDEDPTNDQNVKLIYSRKSQAKSNHDSTGWNREHVWPKSYGVGYSGADYSDLLSLRLVVGEYTARLPSTSYVSLCLLLVCRRSAHT